jgi:hypothetical protein
MMDRRQQIVKWRLSLGLVLLVGLAVTCITPFVNDKWWFAREQALLRSVLDLLRWIFLIGGFVYSKQLDTWNRELKELREAGKPPVGGEC